MNVYADNAATTAVSDAALAAMLPCFQEFYGNPSSLYTTGQLAAEKLAAAREIWTFPSSRGWRRHSSTSLWNSGSSSRKSTPLWAREISPGRMRGPPPASAAEEAV